MTIDLKTKILHDIAYQMKKMLKEWKTSFSCDEKDEEVILEYLNTVEKLILPKPRTVLVSKELQKKIENKNFTEKGQTVSAKKASEIVDDIEYFEDQFKRGRDVNNHLSKQIYNSKCKDILLNTWNIKHIHLNKAEAKSMESMKNNRADFLLFCIVEDSDVLFLDVRRHPNKRGYSSYSLLQIAFNNDWMTHLGFEEVDDYIPYSMEPIIKNDEDLYELYRENCNLPFDFEGHAFINISNGIVGSGDKKKNVRRLLELKRRIGEIPFTEADYLGMISSDVKGILGTIRFQHNNVKVEYQLSVDLCMTEAKETMT